MGYPRQSANLERLEAPEFDFLDLKFWSKVRISINLNIQLLGIFGAKLEFGEIKSTKIRLLGFEILKKARISINLNIRLLGISRAKRKFGEIRSTRI